MNDVGSWDQGFTTCCREAELCVKLALPLNKASMRSVPDGKDEVVTEAVPFTTVTGAPSNMLFARNVTVPAGTAPGQEIVAVNVTGCPWFDPCGAEEARKVFVASLLPSEIFPIAMLSATPEKRMDAAAVLRGIPTGDQTHSL